ncbi:MAG: helicase, partial [Hyphomicrobiales bacterium]|nr:helicase [Hyphomicrobiales bacterium]
MIATSFDLSGADRARAVGVTIALGPTNTGKTHRAIERMLAHPSGVIGLPLRLLAREVYQRVVERVGEGAVALVTGEEKIKPEGARYWVATVEAMPADLRPSFLAVDEIQLAADLDRGHVFTQRLLEARGVAETMFVGAETMRRPLEALLPGAPVVTRPRLSTLSHLGDRKISRLPPRTAIVAFSAEDVYAIAEFVRRRRGGAAVVLGALSPRTRNAQVEMFQAGEVDHLVATDAIGLGLNLDLDCVAFASDQKYDGRMFRRLTPAEFAQIAGRAGRNAKDGRFATTGRCQPFEPDLVEAIETHSFDAVRALQWREADLDFSSLAALRASLDRAPPLPGLVRAPQGEDEAALERLAADAEVRKSATHPAEIRRLWEACRIPDYRKLSPAAHADLAATIYRHVVRGGRIPDAWMAGEIATCDRMDG